MPLWIIKNITLDLTKKIIEARGSGYTDIFDFAYKTKDFITKGIMENLIRAGAMDNFSLNHLEKPHCLWICSFSHRLY